MLRALTLIIGSMLAIVLTGDLRSATIEVSDIGAIDDACDSYNRRAGMEPQHRAATFTNFLATACDEARRSLYAPNKAEREAARLLLARIVELQQTVDEMNAERTAAVADRSGVERMQALSRVTQSGEFLIAHRMGVMQAYDAWLDSGGDFSLAFYR